MASGVKDLIGRTTSKVTLAEGLTLLLFPASVILFLTGGVPYGYLFAEAATGVARLAFLFLPLIIIKLTLDFTGIRTTKRRAVFSVYFAGLLALFLFSPLFGYLPRISEVKRLSTFFIYASFAALAVYGIISARARLRNREEHRAITRDHLSTLGIVTRAAALLILCYVVHSNLKAAIPLFRIYNWDHTALRLDTLLFFGQSPYLLLHNLFPPVRYTLFFEQFYFFFFYFNAFGLCSAFVFGSAQYLLKVTNTVVLAYHIGLVTYWVFPTLGPCFFNETAYLFNRLPENMALKPMLYGQFMSMATSPATFKAGLFNGLAAFPSLHVTHSLIYLFYLWPRQKLLTILNIPPFILLCVSTVYLGWHYVIDIPAGALVGAAAILVVHMTFVDSGTV
jgi:membrane-associated phospholipid phosphatase